MCRSRASVLRRKSLGYAPPSARHAASLPRRSAISLFSSGPGGSCALTRQAYTLQSGLERGFHEAIEIPVEHGGCVAHFHGGAQVLDPRLIEHVGADLMSPANIGLGILQHTRCGISLVDLELVELRLQHLHRHRAVLVLAALVLACDHDAP